MNAFLNAMTGNYSLKPYTNSKEETKEGKANGKSKPNY